MIGSGSQISVVASGFPSPRANLKRVVNFLKNQKFQPQVPADLFGKHPICANTHEARARHLVEALQDKNSEMIWFLRGGYGMIHLLAELNKLRKPRFKLCMGYSDVTSFLIFAVQKWRWPVIHGPLLDGISSDQASAKCVKRTLAVLRGNVTQQEFQLRPMNSVKKSIQGELLGGNLTVAASTLGTPYQLSGEKRVLFFEEVGERAYRVDRHLIQMKQAGVFYGARGIIFGRFLDCVEPSGRSIVRQILSEFAQSMKIPVYEKMPTGHGKVQYPLPMGTLVRVDKEARFSMSFSL